MSIMDLYREICLERFGLNEPAKPVAYEDTEEPSTKVTKKKKEPSASKSSVNKRSLSVDSAKPPIKKCKVVKVAKCNPSQKITDDGFKIVSEMDLPSDDSDISDAFESDEEITDTKVKQAESKKMDKAIKIAREQPKLLQCKSADPPSGTSVNAKFTDDGFRIVSYISDDDSDISDAFNSEGSDCEEDVDGKQMVASVTDRSTAGTLCKKSSSEFGVIKNNAKPTAEKTIVDGKISEGESKKKKRKRGSRNKNKSSTGIGAKPNNSKTIPHCKKKDKDKKNGKPRKETVSLTKDDIEAIKAKIPPKVQKIIIEFGLDWAKFDTPAEREKRGLAKLPQPEQIPNCSTYLKKDAISGKIITVYDYSKKRGGTSALAGALNAPKSGSRTAAVVSSGMKQAGVVSKTSAANVSKANKNAKPGDVPLTKEQLELIEKKKQMKAEHLEELRAIKRNIVNNVINKSLDPRSKDQKRLALIQKLGGVVKKPYVNYKVLMANKKKEKQEAEVARENLKNLGMHDMLKKKRRQFRKKDPNEVSGFNSLGGRIRDGVMVIGKKDIARLNA